MKRYYSPSNQSNNKFLDCAGSFTCRSKADDPALSFTMDNNRFEYQPTGDYAQHPLFWSALEVNNCLKVVATGNATTNASKTSGGTRGFFQCFSRSPHAWSLTFDHPTSGAPLSFESALPRDMEQLIAAFATPRTAR